MINKLLQAASTPEANTAGVLTTLVATMNSFFQMFNPVLTGIFYVASIGWLLVQIFYKIKSGGK